jgi:small subunit ribosomal protein S16
MSITIRLTRIGKKNSPAYRVVVSNTKDKRNGKSLDILGHYNPTDSKSKFEIDKEKYAAWVGKGAMVSDAVKQLLEGKYSYTPYRSKKAVTEATE